MDNNNEFIHEDEQKANDVEPAQSQTVSPLRGFFWLERSLSDIYAPNFKSWFVAALIYSAITGIIPALVPATALIIAIANPLLVAGLLIGAHNVYKQQGDIKPLQMFEAFKHKNIAQLVIYTVAAIALGLGIIFILMSIVGMEVLSGIDAARIESGDEAYFTSVLKTISPAIPWAALLIILFSLATWFAVSLILFSDQKAVPAIGNSFVGGLKNFFAVLVFIIVLIVCGFVLILISSLVLAMFGSLLENPFVDVLFNVLINALALPIFIGVTYIAYREIFLGDITKSDKSL
ncbi:BPSS1780 family membrane protein [Kangiella marina]|uniref:Glycerophosphoryl diester phosphodiesterase membrane domain-containing protein n=1 Tax=Kangiella marina TaxID=1079178 RepID=A0ABP8IFA9_9GAMM